MDMGFNILRLKYEQNLFRECRAICCARKVFNTIFGKIRSWKISIGWNLSCKEWSIMEGRKEGRKSDLQSVYVYFVHGSCKKFKSCQINVVYNTMCCVQHYVLCIALTMCCVQHYVLCIALCVVYSTMCCVYHYVMCITLCVEFRTHYVLYISLFAE